MSPGNIDDVNAPKSIKNIVLEVIEYVEKHTEVSEWQTFEPYDSALHALWPELFKASREAALRVSVAIFLDVAERKGFKVEPPELKEFDL